MAVFQKGIQSFVAVLVAPASCKKQNSGFTCINSKSKNFKFDFERPYDLRLKKFS